MLAVSWHPAYTQLLYPDAYSMGMGQSATAGQGVEGVFFNPAGLAGEAQRELLLTFVRPYARLNLHGLAMAWSKRAGAWVGAGGIELFGDELYQQSRVSLALARNFGTFQLGLCPEWKLESLEGSYSNFSLLAGSQWKLSDLLRIGFAFRQPIRDAARTVTYPEFRTGVQWQAGEKIVVTGEYVYQDPAQRFSTGISYQPSPGIQLRGGIRYGPPRIFMGVRYGFSEKTVDYAAGLDPLLGSAHALSIRWTKPQQP